MLSNQAPKSEKAQCFPMIKFEKKEHNRATCFATSLWYYGNVGFIDINTYGLLYRNKRTSTVLNLIYIDVTAS